jgi:hypothetical protein
MPARVHDSHDNNIVSLDLKEHCKWERAMSARRVLLCTTGYSSGRSAIASKTTMA